jgi:hypothetical protein
VARALIAVIVASYLSACSTEGDNYSGGTIDVVVDEASPSAVMLYVSNQSFEDSTVDIIVTLDGDPIIDRDFDVSNQHNWIPYLIRLAPGAHTLTASSSTGASFETLFETTDVGTRYAVLSYWHYPADDNGRNFTPRSFTFEIQDDPVGFA